MTEHDRQVLVYLVHAAGPYLSVLVGLVVAYLWAQLLGRMWTR